MKELFFIVATAIIIIGVAFFIPFSLWFVDCRHHLTSLSVDVNVSFFFSFRRVFTKYVIGTRSHNLHIVKYKHCWIFLICVSFVFPVSANAPKTRGIMVVFQWPILEILFSSSLYYFVEIFYVYKLVFMFFEFFFFYRVICSYLVSCAWCLWCSFWFK